MPCTIISPSQSFYSHLKNAGSWKVQCCGLLAILITAAILTGPTVGLSFLYARQQEKTVQVCNTKSDAFQVYSKSEVVLMKDVCMTVPQPEVTNWSLYTANCKRKIKQHNHTINRTSSESETLLYRLYMVGASYIVPTEQNNVSYIKYQKTDSAEKASTYNKFTCATKGRDLNTSRPLNFNHPGYYVILCIIPEKNVEGFDFVLNVIEHYYKETAERSNCTVTNSKGAEICCSFSQRNCVYLSPDDPRQIHHSDLIPVYVEITYADSLNKFLIVALSLIAIFAVVVLALIYFFKVRWRR